MTLARIVSTALVLSWAASAAAEELPEAAPARDLSRVELIDEVPNYAAILVHQWSSGVPEEDVEIGRSGYSYGRLVETSSRRDLTLRQCVALALTNNTRLKVSRLDPVAGAVSVRDARSVFDPEFFAETFKTRSRVSNASTANQGGNVFTATTDTIFEQTVVWDAGLRKNLLSGGGLSLLWENDRISRPTNIANQLRPRYETYLNLSLVQPLLRDLGWRYSLLLVDVAQNTEEQAFFLHKAAVADVVLAVERAYWLLVLAIENVKVGEQGLDLANETLRQNEGRFKVGALPRTAVLEAEAEVARREAILVRLRNARSIAEDNLRAVINFRPQGSEAIVVIEPADAPAETPYEIDLENSLRVAAQARPELAAARLDVDGKRILRKVAENQLLPRLDFSGAVGVNGLGGDDTGARFAIGDPEDPNTPVFGPNPQIVGGYDRSLHLLTDGRFYQYRFGVTLEIPIANASAKAQFAQARVDTERAWLSLQELEENVTLQVKQAVTNMESEIEGLPATRIARELAEENLRNQQARYEVGLATTKDLLDFQERMLQARAAEVEALTGYNVAMAEGYRAEGSLLEERDVVVERAAPEKPAWWARF